MPPPGPPVPTDDAARLETFRAGLPALAAGIYLNTGSSGPLPAETAAAMAQQADYELQVGRGHVDGFQDALQRMEEARASAAAVLTVDVDDIGLTHGASDGMNHGLLGLPWRTGDRVLTTRHEHPGGSGPVVVLRERYGVEATFLDIGDGGDEDRVLSAFRGALDERVKAVAISHVLWTTGAIMPVRAIADLAHQVGALVVVDAAQSAGAIPVDVGALGADVLAAPAQKWLLGPEGMGAVAVTAAARERLAPTFGGWFAFERIDDRGEAAIWPSARRFEATGFHRPSVVGMARSIGWLSMFIGLGWIHERGARLAAAMRERLAAIEGVTMLTPTRHAGLLTFRIDGWSAEEARLELGARVFAVTRTIASLDAVRISVAAFHTEAELERFAESVALLAAHTPATIPARRTLTLLGDG